METREVGDKVKKGMRSLLADKPVWAFWIAYSALSGILFGVFYAAMYFMALQWWIPAIAIIAVGTVWGSIAYAKRAGEPGKERKPDEKVA